jgi:hypothetical protein
MTEQPSLIRADLLSYVGLQVVLLGLMMFAIGVWFGVVWIGEAAWSSMLASSPVTAQPDPPAYLQTASAINLWAVAVAVVSLLGLLGLDWVGRDG